MCVYFNCQVLTIIWKIHPIQWSSIHQTRPLNLGEFTFRLRRQKEELIWITQHIKEKVCCLEKDVAMSSKVLFRKREGHLWKYRGRNEHRRYSPWPSFCSQCYPVSSSWAFPNHPILRCHPSEWLLYLLHCSNWQHWFFWIPSAQTPSGEYRALLFLHR